MRKHPSSSTRKSIFPCNAGHQEQQLLWLSPEELAHLRRLKRLRLSANSLSGELPESIFDNLPHLELLYLSYNMLQGKLPSTLSKCKKLQYLSLVVNNFTGAIPKEIGNLKQLKWMYLGNNKLQGSIPKDIGNLIQLKIMHHSSSTGKSFFPHNSRLLEQQLLWLSS
ncbi:hypothetical protein Pint_11706 [Pistacia integerrima]|uniref:Uncharacterized protein n=1 Tax=Pistacia integerrima TaxID=434235 RepID=A0ACC0XLJ9_9ROSI|nr:hypothetical protein Pint_11706 [Pistacia integerrima]